jgi:hypothetical protein
MLDELMPDIDANDSFDGVLIQVEWDAQGY